MGASDINKTGGPRSNKMSAARREKIRQDEMTRWKGRARRNEGEGGEEVGDEGERKTKRGGGGGGNGG